jgi:peroxiredoxin Q/BCP
MKKPLIIAVLFICLILVFLKVYPLMMKKIEVGDKLPTFSLQDQNNNTFNSVNYIGKPLVIYFYPKDDTPGCTKEACKFRDDFESFTDLGALVVGISADSAESHKKFEEKYNLPFILLADTKNEVRKLFGVPNNLFFIPGRVTYVIDKNGTVQYIFNSQLSAEKHIENALQKLKIIS